MAPQLRLGRDPRGHRHPLGVELELSLDSITPDDARSTLAEKLDQHDLIGVMDYSAPEQIPQCGWRRRT